MKIYDKKSILEKVDWKKMFKGQKKAFKSFSSGELNSPPVGHLLLEKGSLHIKYAHMKKDPEFVVKLATGFPGNASLGFSTTDGCFLVFCSETGALKSILFDEGELTDCRTVLASCVATEALNEKKPDKVVIIGTGRIAKLQAVALYEALGVKEFLFLGRRKKALEEVKETFKRKAFEVKTAILSKVSLEELFKDYKTIITTTTAKSFVLPDSAFLDNHVIVALGADEKGKEELDPKILGKADLLICDAREQSLHHGEFQNLSSDKKVFELGEILLKEKTPLKDSLRVCDLTGIAAQDVQIVQDLSF